MINRLAWVTTRAARGTDLDEPLALAALADADVDVDVVDWDDPRVAWASYDRVALRSLWDYPERLDEFHRWLGAVESVSTVVNPPAIVRWNLDKHYLTALADEGVPITPTVFVEPGSAAEFPDGEYVVKPAVGAGSRGAASYGPGQNAVATEHVERLHAAGTSVLVQPLLASVAAEGEWPLMFFDGVYSHAASKRVALPRAGLVEGLFAEERTATHTADDAQLAVAGAAIAAVTARVGAPAYARVDLVRDDDNQYCVLEVELIEPSLFLPDADPGAAGRLAAALIR